MRPTCAQCAYYMPPDVDFDRFHDQCRRHPPTVTSGCAGRWPIVTPEDWCGELLLKLEHENSITVTFGDE